MENIDKRQLFGAIKRAEKKGGGNPPPETELYNVSAEVTCSNFSGGDWNLSFFVNFVSSRNDISEGSAETLREIFGVDPYPCNGLFKKDTDPDISGHFYAFMFNEYDEFQILIDDAPGEPSPYFWQLGAIPYMTCQFFYKKIV